MGRRSHDYPVKWTVLDRNSTWLDPSRLLVTIYMNSTVTNMPTAALLDGKPIEVKLATNSPNTPYVSDPKKGTFLGWFIDVSEVEIEKVHDFRVKLPQGFDNYQGIFFDNVQGAGESGIVRAVSPSQAHSN